MSKTYCTETVARDYFYEAAAGNIDGVFVVKKFGRNDDIDTATTPEDVWLMGGSMIWPTSAGPVGVSSTDTDDDGVSGSSTGAHQITIEGLGANFNALSETITLAGTSTVFTSNNFLRINRAFVQSVGTYHGNNEGTIEGFISGDSMFRIGASVGQTQIGRYTVPADKKARVISTDITVGGGPGNISAQIAALSFWQVQNADDVVQPFSGGKRLVRYLDSVTGVAAFSSQSANVFPEKTDIWWTVEAVSANNTAVSVDFEIVVIDD